MHHLDIDIPVSLRPASFKVTDCSQYDGALPIEGGLLHVTPPSCQEPVLFKVEPYFTLVLNANLLHLNPMGMEPLPALPEGSYLVSYSVKPHSRVTIRGLYFRNTLQQLRYLDLVSKLQNSQALFTTKDYHQHVRTLIWTKQIIDAARYSAEERHDLNGANYLYQEATRQLDKLSNYVR